MLELLGGLGLFLLGMSLLSDGLRSMAGRAFNRALHRFTKSPLSGAVTGGLATALVQSSSATTVATVGLVAGGMLSFRESLGLLFGANIGTTLTGWMVALLGFKLKLGSAMLPGLLAGVLLMRFGRARWKHVGRALAGLSLLFFGLELMRSGTAPFEGALTPSDFPPDTWLGRIGLVGIGIAITLVTQSSSAGVATALAALASGLTSFPQAAAMVIGMDLGTTSTTALAAIGGSAEVRRTAYSHVIYNAFTAVGALLLLGPYGQAFEKLFGIPAGDEPMVALVGFHTTFNTLGVVLVLPLTGAFARLMLRLVPPAEDALVERLDASLTRDPEAALSAISRTLGGLTAASAACGLELLAGRQPVQDPQVLKQAVSATRRFADRVHATSAEPQTRAPLIATFHILDHMDRLVDRLAQSERLETLAVDPRLAELTDSFRQALRELEGLGRGTVEGDAASAARSRIDEVRHEIEAAEQPFRERSLGLAAEDAINLNESLRRLDSIRWLVRSAFHVARIARYLRV